MIRDLNRHSDGIDETNQNSRRLKKGLLGGLGRAARGISHINTALTLMDTLVPPREEQWDCTGTGWGIYTKCATPSPAYDLGYSAVGRGPGNTNSKGQPTDSILTDARICLAGQAIPAAGLFNPWNPSYVLSQRSLGIGRTRTVPGPTYRAQVQIGFYRPAGTTAMPYPQLQAAIASAYALPSLPGKSWPITAFPDEFAPLATPAFADAIPWALVPSRETEDERVLPRLQPSRRPVDWSVQITSPVPGADGGNNFKPPVFHDYQPPNVGPDPRNKERKMRMGPAMARAMHYIGKVTEGADAVDALYRALPSEYRPRFKNTKYELRNVSYRQKLQALYDHWDKVPLDKAVYNLVRETVMDRVWGSVGKVGGDISKRLGHHYGAGVNSLHKRTFNLTR